MAEAHVEPDLDQDASSVRRDFWSKIGRVAARIPFAEDAVAAYYCAFDRETPLKSRGMLLAALAYFILPVDAVPDVLPAIGFVDDASVLAIALTTLGAHIRPRHREAARSALDELRAGNAPKAA